MLEMVLGHPDIATSRTQSTLHAFLPMKTMPSFGNFSDPDRYCGFVPSDRYLARMMNKAIERDEPDANQHTACLAPDQIAINDSHKVGTIVLSPFLFLIPIYLQVNKHIAKIDGVAVFTALWTCMTSIFIYAQALTLTKAHEERAGPLMGIANSVRLYGHSNPVVAYSDDPVKVTFFRNGNFPSVNIFLG